MPPFVPCSLCGEAAMRVAIREVPRPGGRPPIQKGQPLCHDCFAELFEGRLYNPADDAVGPNGMLPTTDDQLDKEEG